MHVQLRKEVKKFKLDNAKLGDLEDEVTMLEEQQELGDAANKVKAKTMKT